MRVPLLPAEDTRCAIYLSLSVESSNEAFLTCGSDLCVLKIRHVCVSSVSGYPLVNGHVL